MSRTVMCRKHKQELPGLDRPPYPGAKGEDIYQHVSKQAWEEWQKHQTMLINENRLSPRDPKHRAFLEAELQKFLFERNADKPEGYVDPLGEE